MKRYYVDYLDCATYECKDGDFVRFEDVEKLQQELRDKEALIVELSKDLLYLKELASGSGGPMGVIKLMQDKINK